jgi:hypothetical protein
LTHPIPDAALDSDIAILGRKGGGKSFTAKGIVERLLDMKRRVLVLDPLGVWAGLRTSADGEGPGYPIAIFGGEHADLPLDPAAAEPLARIVAAENLPAVVDLSDLSKGAQQAFLLKFLHELRRVNREALTIVLEEADVFAPQNPQGDDSKALHGEIDWISRRGRFRGFRLISICQRPARLSKDVLTQANMLIMHRLPAPQDREAAKAWVDGNGDRDQAKVVFDTLSNLAVGEAWVLAQEPAMLERVKFPLIKTLDTSATPKAGERRIEPKTLAQVDVSAIREALAVSKEAVTGNVASEKDISREIAAAETRGYDRGYQVGYLDARNGLTRMFADRVAAVADEIRGNGGGRAEDILVPIPAPATTFTLEARASTPKVTPQATPKVSSSETLSPSARKIVDAVKSAYPMGLSLVVAAKRAGLSSRSSAYRKHMQDAAACPEIVERADGNYVAAAPPDGIRPPPGVAAFREKLPPAYAKMLDVIENHLGRPVDKATIASQAGVSPTSSGLGAGLKELVALDLVVKTDAGWALSPDFLDQ